MLRSKISMSVSAALLLGMVSIAGCGTNDAVGNTNVNTKSVRGTNDGRLNVNSVRGGTIRANTTDKMEMSQDLADRISALSEVRTANVVLLGKSAYVAVTLDKATAGPQAGTGRSMTGTDRTMGGTGTMPGTMGTTGTTGNTGINGNRTTDVMDGRGMKREIDRGIGNGMGTGMGMGTNNTTPDYNMTATETDTVTKEMKDKIAAEVKKHAPQINAVYVSTNPDFVERVNVYAEEARAGHPLKGFAKEFGTMVERIFPTRSDR